MPRPKPDLTEISNLCILGKSIDEICKATGYSRGSVVGFRRTLRLHGVAIPEYIPARIPVNVDLLMQMYAGGYSQKEIAEVCGCGKSTIRRNIHWLKETGKEVISGSPESKRRQGLLALDLNVLASEALFPSSDKDIDDFQVGELYQSGNNVIQISEILTSAPSKVDRALTRLLEGRGTKAYSIETESKKCPKCEEVKPLGDFHKYYKSRHNVSTYCKDCRKSNPMPIEDRREYERKYRSPRRYGVPLEYLESIKESQKGLCAICSSTCRTGRDLSLDHDHLSGKIRGYLCNMCNIGLGVYRDSPELLKQAAQYLEKHSSSKSEVINA